MYMQRYICIQWYIPMYTQYTKWELIKMFAKTNNNMQTIGTREDRGKAIAEKDGQIKRIDDYNYKVKSQSKDISYNVILTTIGWKCTSPDHETRGVKCKHIYAVEFSFKIRQEVKKNIVIEPVIISDCPFCHSTNIKKFGIRHNKSGGYSAVCMQ
jgi:hypothetical protein